MKRQILGLIDMFRIFLVLAFLVINLCPSFAETTKLLCRNQFNDTSSGPMEIDLATHTVYRFVQRQPWTITSVTSDYITMMFLSEVGGEIAVMDLASGVLQVASVGFFPEQNNLSSTTLRAVAVSPMICKKSILSD